MLKKALVFILILFFTAALLPLWIMWRDFQVSRLDADTVRPADAAVVLSTRAYEKGRLNPCLVARVEAAVELYRARKVKKLVMTGGVSRDLQSSAGNMQMIAEKMGVSKADIIQEREAGNTFAPSFLVVYHKLIGFLHSFNLRVRELSRIALKHGHSKALE